MLLGGVVQLFLNSDNHRIGRQRITLQMAVILKNTTPSDTQSTKVF